MTLGYDTENATRDDVKYVWLYQQMHCVAVIKAQWLVVIGWYL